MKNSDMNELECAFVCDCMCIWVCATVSILIIQKNSKFWRGQIYLPKETDQKLSKVLLSVKVTRFFFYKQHFYKQQKAENRQKLSTC